jgi:hypothetical protein
VTKEQFSTLLEAVRSWPEEDQEEFIKAAREIEARRVGSYRAAPEELQAIDESDRSGVAIDRDVEAAFKTFREA